MSSVIVDLLIMHRTQAWVPFLCYQSNKAYFSVVRNPALNSAATHISSIATEKDIRLVMVAEEINKMLTVFIGVHSFHFLISKHFELNNL